jgi:hypothetical protein
VYELPAIVVSSHGNQSHLFHKTHLIFSSAMVASSSTAAAITLMPVSKKLTRGNFIIWKAQVLTILHGTQLTEFLDGSNSAPAEKLMVKIQKEKTEEVPNPAFASLKACA